MTSQLQNSLIRLENFQKLTELQHDLLGIDNLVAAGRVSSRLLLQFRMSYIDIEF